GLLDGRPILEGNGVGKILGPQRAQYAQGHLRPDPLNGLQGAEPGALDFARKSKQADRVLAHMGLDGEAHLLTKAQRTQGSCRGLYLIADAADVDDGVSFAD